MAARDDMTEHYELERWIWTEADFDRMGWHDARIYAFALFDESHELALDIDYIFEWVKPQEPYAYYSFWVAPCTLVFENVHDLEIDLSPYRDLSIDNVLRKEADPPRNAEYIGKSSNWTWTLDCLCGTIEFHAAGYKQHVRQAPTHRAGQTIPMTDRGGISFAREGFSR